MLCICLGVLVYFRLVLDADIVFSHKEHMTYCVYLWHVYVVYFRPVLHADIVISHKEPVTCCMYNPSFKQVVTCSESSVSMLSCHYEKTRGCILQGLVPLQWGQARRQNLEHLRIILAYFFLIDGIIYIWTCYLGLTFCLWLQTIGFMQGARGQNPGHFFSGTESFNVNNRYNMYIKRLTSFLGYSCHSGPFF